MSSISCLRWFVSVISLAPRRALGAYVFATQRLARRHGRRASSGASCAIVLGSLASRRSQRPGGSLKSTGLRLGVDQHQPARGRRRVLEQDGQGVPVARAPSRPASSRGPRARASAARRRRAAGAAGHQWALRSGAASRRSASSAGDEVGEAGIGSCPVQPGGVVVLAIGVVVAALAVAELVAGQQHRRALRQQQRGQQHALQPAGARPARPGRRCRLRRRSCGSGCGRGRRGCARRWPGCGARCS